MKKLILLTSLLLLTTIASLASAGVITDKSLDKLMALSGLNKQTAELPGVVRAGVEQARQGSAPLPDEAFQEIQIAMEDAFQPSALLGTIKNEVKNNVSESDAQYLLSWYESETGKRITAAEEKASTPEAYQAMVQEAQSLVADSQRLAIARQVESLVHSTDMMLDLQRNTGIALFTAFSTAMDPGAPVDVEAFNAQMSAQEPQMRANTEQFVLLSLVYSYKTIDMESLEKYVAFLGNAKTGQFNKSVSKGMNDALNKSIAVMAKSLVTTFLKHKNG